MQTKPEKKTGWLVGWTPFYTFARLVAWFLCLFIYPSRFYNRERLDRDAPYLIVSNHQSMMDPLLLAIRVWRYEIRFLGKDTLRKHPAVRFVVDHLHMIPVVRKGTDMGAIRACLKALKENHVVGIFPEGTRKEQNMMEEMGSGVGLLALRSGVPVIPVYVAERPLPFRFTNIYVGEAIDYEDLKQIGTNKETCEMLTMRIKDATYKMQEMAHPKCKT